jgi:hypothetical protein
MPCDEFVKAISWSKQSKYSAGSTVYPVEAYFTKHYGSAPGAYTGLMDKVHYSSGTVVAVDTPTPHLKGTLNVSVNTQDVPGGMHAVPAYAYDIEIFPDGAINYLLKYNGNPVGGMPPTKVQGTCVNGVLLTATETSDVVAVGVARRPSYTMPPA